MLVDKVSEFAQLGPNWNGNGPPPLMPPQSVEQKA